VRIEKTATTSSPRQDWRHTE